MKIVKVLAVYRLPPLLLVVEGDDGMVAEVSLAAIEAGGYRLSDAAWKDLLEKYQLFTAPATRREGVRLPRSARHHRPPACD
jgi:hypothetical protein